VIVCCADQGVPPTQELARQSNSNEAAHKATVEADNAYTEFGWVGKRDNQEATVEADNAYTEFGWVGKREEQGAEGSTVEAANGYTEFGWVGKRDN
jgi:predicted TIM-barrel fold metal-dependent hydrolase